VLITKWTQVNSVGISCCLTLKGMIPRTYNSHCPVQNKVRNVKITVDKAG
jgi:hypothetical protein